MHEQYVAKCSSGCRSAHLIGRAVAIFEAAHKAKSLPPLALHEEHRVHYVLQHARPGNRAILRQRSPVTFGLLVGFGEGSQGCPFVSLPSGTLCTMCVSREALRSARPALRPLIN